MLEMQTTVTLRHSVIVGSLLLVSVTAFVPRTGWWAPPRAYEGIRTLPERHRLLFVELRSTPSDTDTNHNKPSHHNHNNNHRNNTRTYNNNNNNNNRRNPSNNNNNNRRSVVGGGGGGGAVLKLENPLKIKKIVDQERADSSENLYASSNTRTTGGGAGRPATGAGTRNKNSGRGTPTGSDYSADAAKKRRRVDSDDRTTSVGPPPSKDFARRKEKGDKEKEKAWTKPAKKKVADDDDRPARRTSLRVQPGKKGRAAEITQRRGTLKKRYRAAEKAAKAEAAMDRRRVQLSDGPMSVGELAEAIGEKPVAVIKFLMTDLGVMASMTQTLDPATCAAVADGFGMIVGDDDEDYDDEDYDEDSALATGVVTDEDDEDTLEPRPVVVTVMGHVDHGKTSLLDAIRKTAVTAGEAGGITQHIAAYQVNHKGNAITFIDTPGHAAFTDMRERGANMTDIVILVVAADDGVKQQTADSLMCARQAGVPVVVAINKCDLDTADPMKVITELTSYDVLTEDLGGEVLSSQISAKVGTNLDDLLDKVLLQAEMLDLRANKNRNAEGIVVEAYVEKGLGTVATTLIKKGTLRIGDIFVAGETYGRVRALISTADEKTRLTEATPSTPVRVVGFEGVPSAGDMFVVADDEQTTRELALSRQRIAREQQSSTYQAGLMSSVAKVFGSTKVRREMCVVVKADVQGSAEALTRALRELKLENDEAVVTIKVLVSEAGEVSKSDIAIASVTPDTTVLAFNVAASFAAMEDARASGIPIQYYNVIYDAIESVESRMQEVLSPTPDGEFAGAAVVQEVFKIGGTGNIAGSRCTDGFLKKGGNVRVLRGDKIMVESRIKTLRNFKSETDRIESGSDCGIGLVDYEDFLPGDIIECYVV